MIGRPAAVTCALALTSCNSYDLFRVSGYEQQSFNNKADVLFIIDNSDSMLEESASLATNFATFIADIDSVEQAHSHNGLSDAVTNYVDYVQNRSGFVDYRFSITTTDVQTDAGKLVGPTVKRGDADVPERFIENLVCEATCFSAAAVLPTDPGYQCGDPLGDTLSEQYVQCVCGASYLGNCGAAVEEGLEAAFLALCRAVPNPPLECFADVEIEDSNGDLQVYPALVDPTDTMSNPDMLRDDANLIVVVVSDEGDGSRRQLREDIPDRYVDLFARFRRRITWVLIGPDLASDNTVRCPGTATDWGVVRYNYMVYTSDGRSIPIFDDNCDTRDFDEALGQLGELLTNLVTSFPLQSVPVPGTIIVLVDGKRVAEAEVTGTDQFGIETWSDGFSYRAADNSVVFHGAAIPTYDANVEVYYQPIDGMPRELPF